MAAATRRSQRLRNSRREFDYKSLLIRDDPKEDASYRSHRKGESNTVATRGRRSAGPEPEVSILPPAK
ncbi:hypothetical protein J1614_000598 [Plenodomus biglobosus]|nr:hypothetical protein J1614_000598 [Plenodomus biglobosus]